MDNFLKPETRADLTARCRNTWVQVAAFGLVAATTGVAAAWLPPSLLATAAAMALVVILPVGFIVWEFIWHDDLLSGKTLNDEGCRRLADLAAPHGELVAYLTQISDQRRPLVAQDWWQVHAWLKHHDATADDSTIRRLNNVN